MIIQSAPEGEASGKRFVMKLAEHLELVGQFAENLGNRKFAAPEPREEFLYACRWHDKGWQDLDDNPPLNPDTGLPYNLVETPLPVILLTSARSPEHNEAHHPYCGLIDSMHIWGLYNGRYGMSDKVLIDMIPDQHRVLADGMLDNEYQRQQRLRHVPRSGTMKLVRLRAPKPKLPRKAGPHGEGWWQQGHKNTEGIPQQMAKDEP